MVSDPLDSLLDTLDVLDGKRRKLWHEVRDAKGAVVGCHPLAVSPRDDDAVADWERRCVEMHAAQEPVTIPDKPPIQSRIAGRRVHVVDAPAVPRFEDQPKAQRERMLDDARAKVGMMRRGD